MRIGIFSGTFDPIHEGHIAAAQAVKKDCGLDKVLFIVEAEPRYKKPIAEYQHRQAMVAVALKPYPDFEFVNVSTAQHSLKTIDELIDNGLVKQNDPLVIMMGSDVAKNIKAWPDYAKLIKRFEVVAVNRNRRVNPSGQDIKIVTVNHPAGSKKIREALNDTQPPEHLNPDVKTYIDSYKLYH